MKKMLFSIQFLHTKPRPNPGGLDCRQARLIDPEAPARNHFIYVRLLQSGGKQPHEVDHVAAQITLAAHDDTKRARREQTLRIALAQIDVLARVESDGRKDRDPKAHLDVR